MSSITPSELKKLLEIYQIPGSHQELEVFACWVEGILESKGEEYVKRNRRKLLRDWINILEYGLTNI